MSTTVAVDVQPTADAVMHAAADMVIASAANAVRASGRFAIALAGGATPRRLYTLLATPAYASRVTWQAVHVFWGDERGVPPDDPASNYRLTRAALLAHVPIPPANVHRIRGEEPPSAAAADYERELRTAFAAPTGPPRHAPGARFDLVLLGMGDNGHTASLFPHRPVLAERERWAVADRVDATPADRVTLTVPALNAAALALFLVVGAEKAPMLRRVLEGPRDPEALPAQLIAPEDGLVRWLVDTAAAAELTRR